MNSNLIQFLLHGYSSTVEFEFSLHSVSLTSSAEWTERHAEQSVGLAASPCRPLVQQHLLHTGGAPASSESALLLSVTCAAWPALPECITSITGSAPS